MKIEKVPQFSRSEIAFDKLKMQIHAKFNANYIQRKNGSTILIGIVLFAVYLILIGALWNADSNPSAYYLTAALMGILCVPMILVIGHESVHGNYSTHSLVNTLGRYVFYFLGTTPYFWTLRHINAHHSFTNIKDWDMDIEQTKIIRLSGEQPHQRYHNYQCYYMPVLFMFYTLNWFFVRDVKDLSKKRFGAKRIHKHPWNKIALLLLAKLWHFTFLIVGPLYFGAGTIQVVIGFFVFHLLASLTTTLVLISTHIGESHELLVSEDERISDHSWIEHQIRSTGDFCTESKWALYFFGGFNHHLTHHLFPNIPFRFYPEITPVIKKYCEDNDLPYHHYDGMLSCIFSHFRRLKHFSQPNTSLI